jgi:penicillin-insensitive murein endopeptidase
MPWPLLLSLFLVGFSDDPTQGRVEQAQGLYSKGKLVNADRFALEGPGMVKIFRPRDRGYATFDLMQVVLGATARLARKFPGGERVQLGDSASKSGGFLSGHDSHQNGLDIDIAYLRNNRQEQDPMDISGFEEEFVADGGITDNFDTERNWAFIKEIHASGRLNRIFVDGVIKKALCDHAREIGELGDSTEVLRALRPWPNHKNHLHVRITCPDRSPRCLRQDPPPPGDGCDSIQELDYDAFLHDADEPVAP